MARLCCIQCLLQVITHKFEMGCFLVHELVASDVVIENADLQSCANDGGGERETEQR